MFKGKKHLEQQVVCISSFVSQAYTQKEDQLLIV